MSDVTIDFSNKIDTSKIITYDFTPNKALQVKNNKPQNTERQFLQPLNLS